MENDNKKVETKNTEKCDVTKLQLFDVTKIWKLKSVDYASLKTKPITSSTISFDELKKYHISASGYLKISYTDPSAYISASIDISLYFNTELSEGPIFILEYVILDANGKKIVESLATLRINEKAQRTHTSFRSIQNHTNVTIICKIKYGLHTLTQDTYTVHRGVDMFKNHNPHKSLSNLMTLLDNNGFKGPDVFISSNDGHTIQVHESILTTAIPKFTKLIKTHDKTIKLNKSSASILEIIRFIYCGEIKNIDKIAVDLLSLAYQFEMNDIKAKCELYLVSNITIQNTVQIFEVADMWDISNLRKQSLKFMINNYNSIVDTEEFKKLESQKENLSEFMKYLL